MLATCTPQRFFLQMCPKMCSFAVSRLKRLCSVLYRLLKMMMGAIGKSEVERMGDE